MTLADTSEPRPTLSRRTLLSNCAIAAAATSLTGCCIPHAMNMLLPVGLAPVGSTSGDLLIDAHCHIFNGSDLPVKEFIADVVLAEVDIPPFLKRVAGTFVKLLSSSAPCGDTELAFLKQLNDNVSQASTIGDAARQHQYTLTRKDALQALKKMNVPALEPPTVAAKVATALEASKALSLQSTVQMSKLQRSFVAAMDPNATEDELKWYLQQSFLPPKLADHESEQRGTLAAMPEIHAAMMKRSVAMRSAAELELAPPCEKPVPTFTIPGLVQYLVENDRYRITEVQDYLNAFTGPNHASRNVDLMVAHLVDYDWWLSQGKANRTTLQRQIDVMSEISIHTRGQVHAFAPFDPLREVAFRARKHQNRYKPWSSLGFVQNAVKIQGSIGVKLYPPMGFGASCNSKQPADLWNFGKFLPWMHDGSMLDFYDKKPSAPFGARLDQVLEELFTWCESEGVPIMAHSAATNGQSKPLEALATAKYWKPVLDSHPRLRINFGHLGNVSKIPPCAEEIPTRANDLIKLLKPTNKGYGDSGYNSEILSINGLEEIEGRYKKVYNMISADSKCLPARIMYGTDWNLLMHVGNVEDYQSHFQAVAEQLPRATEVIQKHTVRDRFLGWNAVDYLGLRKTDQTRVRLEAFYAANGMNTMTQKPEWMRKVDDEAP